MSNTTENSMISRADSRSISKDEQKELLNHYGLDEPALIGEGTEARVYNLDSQRILKVYFDSSRRSMLMTLKDFYDSLDATQVPFEIPLILGMEEHGDLLAVIEKKILGSPMSEVLTDYTSGPLQQLYVEAVAQLENVIMRKPLQRFMLFDSQGISSTEATDWHGFLHRLIINKLPSVTAHLELDVPDFTSRIQSLLSAYTKPYQHDLKVVHGDIYPGNILMTSSDKVSGIIDFGTFTMLGDPLFDVATSWGFFGMYEDNRVSIRDQLLNRVLNQHGEQCQETLYRYLLTYSILSCDLYPEETCSIRETGHYQWAAEILADYRYWAQPISNSPK